MSIFSHFLFSMHLNHSFVCGSYLIDWSIDRLIDWLIDWLIDGRMYCYCPLESLSLTRIIRPMSSTRGQWQGVPFTVTRDLLKDSWSPLGSLCWRNFLISFEVKRNWTQCLPFLNEISNTGIPLKNKKKIIEIMSWLTLCKRNSLLPTPPPFWARYTTDVYTMTKWSIYILANHLAKMGTEMRRVWGVGVGGQRIPLWKSENYMY